VRRFDLKATGIECRSCHSLEKRGAEPVRVACRPSYTSENGDLWRVSCGGRAYAIAVVQRRIISTEDGGCFDHGSASAEVIVVTHTQRGD